MKKFKLLLLLLATFSLGGCMATLSPDGTVSASYVLPVTETVVIDHHRPVRVAQRPSPRTFSNRHGRPTIYGPRGRYHPF